MRQGYGHYPKQVFAPCALKQSRILVREPLLGHKSHYQSAGKMKTNTSGFLCGQCQLQILAATVPPNVKTTDISRK